MSNLMSSSKRTLIYGAIIFSATLVSGVGVNYVLAGSPDVENEGVAVEDVEAKIQAAVDAGEITQEQADEKRAYWAEGDKRFEKECDWKPMSPEEEEAAIQAAVDAGEITQEEADKKRAG